MSDVDEMEDAVGEVPVALAAPASAVVVVGPGVETEESVAVWHVSPQGMPVGAWIYSLESLLGSRDEARRLLTLVERRSITGVAPGELDEVLGRVTRAAGVDAEKWWTAQLFSPLQCFADIVDRRAAYDETVSAAKRELKNVADVGWSRDFAAERLISFDDLRSLSRVRPVVGSTAVGSGALTVVGVLRWLVRQWVETEGVKRRRYVREAYGDAEPLPPSWLASVQAGMTTRLPL
ncbi:DUF6218 family protein [Amycolatopsis sp. BJA-103]|uniref:DUF6218 family protein n=1 Tax=Amycolatopsis sp. BJA-103 TaxID=1911175 RepID=UPI000C767F49|nr:DUF6218 family protein [Amycolatopsis sp. BJA-103]AUI58414.1 hypothetical protein BKN51_09415 [Amycolatopsis sp. BJA-103]PNE15092.1 hypothetical protein B1H26_31390 [Amycolatopsis sp. BJA-103]